MNDKINLLNEITNEAIPYIKNYIKACNELIKKPVNCYEDNNILVKYGLKECNVFKSSGFDWCYNLKQLDKKYRQVLKIKFLIRK